MPGMIPLPAVPAPDPAVPALPIPPGGAPPLPALPPPPPAAATPPPLPAAAPEIPVTPPVVPPAADPVEAAKTNFEDTKQLGADRVKIAEEKATLDDNYAKEREKFVADHAREYQKLVDAQETHRQAAAAAVTQARAKAESEPYSTLMGNKTLGEKALIAIGLIVGGVSWSENHVNRGVKMLESAMADHMELQKQKHADLWKAVEAAERGETALDRSQLRELSVFNANEGARWDAIAGRLGAMAAANKGKGDVAEARKQAIEASQKANAFWKEAEAAAAHARHLTEMEKLRAQDIANRKKKAAATGGSGGGSAIDKAAAELREAVEKAEAEKKPLTGAQIERLAIEKKIPFNAKAGRTSLKTIMDQIRHDNADENRNLTHGEKAEVLIIRDPKTRAPLGKAPSSRVVSKFNADNINLGEAADRMKDLYDDIKKYGTKVTSPEDVARRVTKYANAVIAIGVVSPLGKTNESLHLEGRSIGLPGAFDPTHMKESLTSILTTTGANAEAVLHKFHEIENKRKAFINTLTPLSDDEKKTFSGSGSDGDKGKRVKQRSTGKIGYMKDGKFTPDA